MVNGNLQEIYSLARANSSEKHKIFSELRIEWEEQYFFQEGLRKNPILRVRLISAYQQGWVKISNSV